VKTKDAGKLGVVPNLPEDIKLLDVTTDWPLFITDILETKTEETRLTATDDDHILLARLLETDTDGNTTAEDDTSTEDTGGNTDVL